MTANSGAEWSRRYRERRRLGVVGVVRVPVYERDVQKLVQEGRLRQEEATDVESIAAAIEDLVDDFTEGGLTGAAGKA